MLKLNIKDKDVTRFLWPEDLNNPNSNLIVYHFNVVLFGATCSQFLLNATILEAWRANRDKSTKINISQKTASKFWKKPQILKKG